MKQTKLNSFFQNKNTVPSKKTIKVKKYKQTKLINEDILNKSDNNISNNKVYSINTDNAIKEKQKKKIKFHGQI